MFKRTLHKTAASRANRASRVPTERVCIDWVIRKGSCKWLNRGSKFSMSDPQLWRTSLMNLQMLSENNSFECTQRPVVGWEDEGTICQIRSSLVLPLLFPLYFIWWGSRSGSIKLGNREKRSLTLRPQDTAGRGKWPYIKPMITTGTKKTPQLPKGDYSCLVSQFNMSR